jgi:hypothetical protein
MEAYVYVSMRAGHDTVWHFQYTGTRLAARDTVIELLGVASGIDTCRTTYLYNDAEQPVTIVGVSTHDSVFHVSSSKPLPYLLAPLDSLPLQVCMTKRTPEPVRDSIYVATACSEFAMQGIYGSAVIKRIDAYDRALGIVERGTTKTSAAGIRNGCELPIRITGYHTTPNIRVLQDSLPFVIPAHGERYVPFECSNPTIGQASDTIYWESDISASYDSLSKSYSVISRKVVVSAGVEENAEEELALSVRCGDDGRITIQITTPSRLSGSVEITDMLGRTISGLRESVIERGSYVFDYDGTALGSGAYICRFEGPGVNLSKMFLIGK